MILALALQAAVAGIPGFPVQPADDERLALPHVADALRATDPATRSRSLASALALLPAPTRFRGAFQCLRGSMLMAADPVGNRTAGLDAIAECRRLVGDLPVALRFAADAAFAGGDFPAGARLLTRALAADPRLARGLTPEQLDSVFRQLGYADALAERRALVVALSKTDAARDDPARYSGWVRTAVLERVGQGDLSGATALLPYVVDPEDGIAMLVDRRYAPLWPRIEAWAGGDLAAQRDALVAAARAAYDLAPTLLRARDTAGVLARTGHAAEGVALLERAVTAFGTPRDDYAYALAVVRLGALRSKAGERDPARVTGPLEAALANGVTGPYLINVVPNLALFQVALGQPEAAMATLDRYPLNPDRVETRAAYGYFVAIRGCALARLGRTGAARAAFADVAQHYAANTGATEIATACGGTDAAVLADWIRRADDPDSRGDALAAMMRARAGAAADPLSLTDPRLRVIAGRREVTERLARHARGLPPGYLPMLRMPAG